ncbi:glutamate racemase [Agaricicola taiwanensis]|nr:glutamate racemase [Agaricicola taiwanensis]
MGVDLMAGATTTTARLVTGRPPRVGVFDSGVGGLTVFAEIIRQMPKAELIYIADDAGFPYGPLSDKALIDRVLFVLEPLIESERLDMVVIACNTASTLTLPVLRSRHYIPFVGTVPAIKTAASLSRSRRVSVLATPGTVARDYTRDLVSTHASDCRVTLVGAADLAAHAEAEMHGAPVSDSVIGAAIAPCFVSDEGGRTDAVVLACTHYPLLLARFEALAPWPVTWINPAAAIARRAATLAGEIDARGTVPPPRAIFTSGSACPAAFRDVLLAGRQADTDASVLPEPSRIAAC